MNYKRVLSSEGEHDEYIAYLITFEHYVPGSGEKERDSIVVYCENAFEAMEIAQKWFSNDLYPGQLNHDRFNTIKKITIKDVGWDGLVKTGVLVKAR